MQLGGSAGKRGEICPWLVALKSRRQSEPDPTPTASTNPGRAANCAASLEQSIVWVIPPCMGTTSVLIPSAVRKVKPTQIPPPPHLSFSLEVASVLEKQQETAKAVGRVLKLHCWDLKKPVNLHHRVSSKPPLRGEGMGEGGGLDAALVLRGRGDLGGGCSFLPSLSVSFHPGRRSPPPKTSPLLGNCWGLHQDFPHAG